MKKRVRNERGIALLLVLVVIVMVTGMMGMVLRISGVERNMAGSNERITKSFQAAGGGLELVNQVIEDTLELSALPAIPKAYPGTIVLDTLVVGGGSDSLPNFVEELQNGGGALANDNLEGVANFPDANNDGIPDLPATSGANGPDLVATAVNGQNIFVDVDFEAGGVLLPGSELQEFGIAHHKKTGGTGCASGNIYTIDTASYGALNTRSVVGSAYFDCE